MNRLLLTVCAFLIVASNVLAQDREGAVGLSGESPVITAAASGDSVRFSSTAGTCEIRVQVATVDGVVLFDSSWKEGDVLDWTAESARQPLLAGTYRCLVMVKDLEGRVSQREATLIAEGGQLSLDARGAKEGLAVRSRTEPAPKITVLAHDGTNGSIVSTGGDLSFRFGNFLTGQDSEKMRLTADGKLGIGTDKPEAALDVSGLIRSTNGILFPDGTILTSVDGQLTTRQSKDGSHERPGSAIAARPAAIALARRTPRTLTVGTPRFITTDTGVGIWNATPAFTLDVGGDINGSEYRIFGDVVLAANVFDNTFVGTNVGASTSGQANTFLGSRSGFSNTSGSNNVFLGKSAGAGNTGGLGNTMTGFIAGASNTTGGSNAMFGSQSGYNNTTGFGNTFIGTESGLSSTVEQMNTALGFQADVGPGATNATAIGARAKATQNNTVILGSINGVNNASATARVGVVMQAPNQALGVGGGITVDENNTNDGTLLGNSVLSFGVATGNAVSGEAIASQRTGTGNLYGLDFYTLYTKRMTITQNGRIGIGTTAPGTDLELAPGKVGRATAWYTWSSARFKTNIQTIESALSKTERLRGVSFDYKDSGDHALGFIAEEVAQVVPEAVQRDANGEVVGLDYNRITPLLVEAVKQQEETLRQQEALIEALMARIEKLESAAASKDVNR